MPTRGLMTVIGAIFILLSLAIDFTFGKLKRFIYNKLYLTGVIQQFMAISVVAFSREGYKIRKVFGLRINCSQMKLQLAELE